MQLYRKYSVVELRAHAERLEKRAFKTYKARLMAANRLRSRRVAWDTFLIATSTSTTVASIGLLSDPAVLGVRGDVIIAMLAVLSLVVSLVVASVDYAGRCRQMDSNYRSIQRISLEAEAMANGSRSARGIHRLQGEYDHIVDASENHSSADYYRAVAAEGGAISPGAVRAIRLDRAVTSLPYLSLILPVVISVSIATWLA